MGIACYNAANQTGQMAVGIGEDVMELLRSRYPLGLAIGGLVLAAGAALPQAASLGTWTFKAPMPVARAEMAAAVVDGKLYAIGGNIGGTAVPHNFEYDPATDTWRQRNPMPVARDHIGIAAVSGKIYTFGGFTHTVHQGASTDVLEYDPAADTVAPPGTPQDAAWRNRRGGARRQDSRDRRSWSRRQDGDHARRL